MSAAVVMLRPEPGSVRDARRHVRAECNALGFARAAYAAELLVSELVTNAVLHARTDIVVRVEPRGDVLRVSVHDDSSQPIRPVEHDVGAVSGRGLHLVERVATAWGVEPAAAGKTVWFELDRGVDLTDVDVVIDLTGL